MAPLLNIDVLAIACEFLTDVSDVLSMALTSSSVHPIAIRWLLHMCPVYLRSGPSICRFHFFLFADEPARAPHIRALHIDLRWPVPAQSRDEICSLLIHILEPCEHLERLTIAFQQESLPIIAEPSFLHAMTAIPSLKSFSVRSASFDGIMLLPHFRTPLCMIGIHTQYATVGTRCPATLKEFLPCAVVNTLENLELDRFAIEPLDAQTPDDVPIPSVFSMAPYPAMRSLSVDSFRGMPLLAHLQHLFPALDGTLHINQFHMWYRISEHVAVEIRARNQRSQDSDGGASRPWQKLDRVVCEAPMFYVLGLRCPIGLAMIHCGSVENYRYAAVALRENPVPRLKLTLYHELGMFEGLFSPELAGRLTHLTLCLLYSNIYEHSTSGRSQADTAANPQFQWQDVLATLITALQPLRKLTHLRIVIGASVYIDKGASWPLPPWGEYAHSLRASRFDFAGTAGAFASGLRSLRHIFLTTGGFLARRAGEGSPKEGGRWQPYERWYVSHGWRVATPWMGDEVQEGGRDLVGLHEQVAETIIRKEGLILSERDESALHLNYGWNKTPPPLSW